MSMWIVRLPRLCSQVPRLRKRALKDKAPFVPDEVSECVMAVLVGDGWCATALPVTGEMTSSRHQNTTTRLHHRQRINTKECENPILIAQIYSRVMFRCGLFERKICEIWRFWGVARTHHLHPRV
ncbi:uncharacterized protein FPRN_03067 [Fusarium proliferatum]|nr:uncharacterized protein FPRN_03067 [Fusarium proliferatum]